MALYERPCPSCGVIISQMQSPVWNAKGFRCPKCGMLLRSSLGDLRLSWIMTLTISAAICLRVGISGLKAIYLLLALAVPLSFLVHALLGLFISRPFELISKE